MSVPQPIDNEKYQFIITNKAEPTNKKVVEFRQKPEQSTAYLVSCWLAAKASEDWLKSQKYPLTKQQALRLLGLQVEDNDNEEERGELLKFLERQRLKKYKSITNYREELDLLNDIKRADSRIGSLINELEIRLESLYKDFSVNVDIEVIEEVDEFFWSIEDYLKKWYFADSRDVGYTSLPVALKDNSVRLRNQLGSRLEDLMFYREVGCLNDRLRFLQELSQDFQELEREYLEEREKCLQLESSWERTYRRHLSFLKGEDEDESCSLEESFEIAKNALLKFYRWKIERESCFYASEVVKDIDSTNRRYLKHFDAPICFLTSIRESFLTEIRKSDTMLPIVSEQVDFLAVLKKVELKIGKTLSSWGRIKVITAEMVKSALLEELEPIAQSICANTKTRLEQEL